MGSAADITKAVTRAPAKKVIVSAPAAKLQAALADTITAAAATAHQADIAAAVASYSTHKSSALAGGFVSPSNWAAYDAAVALAQSSRTSALALARGLSE